MNHKETSSHDCSLCLASTAGVSTFRLYYQQMFKKQLYQQPYGQRIILLADAAVKVRMQRKVPRWRTAIRVLTITPSWYLDATVCLDSLLSRPLRVCSPLFLQAKQLNHRKFITFTPLSMSQIHCGCPYRRTNFLKTKNHRFQMTRNVSFYPRQGR